MMPCAFERAQSVRRVSSRRIGAATIFVIEEKHLLAEDPKYRAYFDWMDEHGLVTSRLRRLGRTLKGTRQIELQPAE